MGTVGSRTLNLQKAREIKSHINAELANLRDGHITLRDVLGSPEDYEMRRLDVYDVLMAAPKLNKDGVRKMCLDTGIWPHYRLEELTFAARDNLIHRIPPRAR